MGRLNLVRLVSKSVGIGYERRDALAKLLTSCMSLDMSSAHRVSIPRDVTTINRGLKHARGLTGFHYVGEAFHRLPRSGIEAYSFEDKGDAATETLSG